MHYTHVSWLQRHYFAVLGTVVLIKIALAWALPLTGDESYFHLWGLHPDYGYYDHPPLAGWWMSFALLFGDHPAWLRSLAIFTSLLPALLLYAIFRRHDEMHARLVSLLALFVPFFMIFVLIATDTPLILFGLLAIHFCQRALAEKRNGLFVLSGIYLGLAFLGKYFAVIIGFGLLYHFLVHARRQFHGLLLILLGVLPFAALNIHWNWNHCWYNVMFNIINRHGGDGASVSTVGLYLLTLLYVVTPWVAWQMWRHRAAIANGVRTHRLGVWLSCSGVAFALFLLMSPTSRIGLHWLAVFIPGVLVAAAFMPRDALRRCVKASALFSLAHLLALAVILAFPLERLQDHPRHRDAMFYLQPYSVGAMFADFPADEYRFFTGSYSRAAVLGYYSGRYFGVLGTGSHYGRQDDLITDFRALDGGNVIYMPRRGHLQPGELDDWFDEVVIHHRDAGGVPYEIAEGRGFRYEVYRKQVIEPVKARYYDFPDWLPVRRCAFVERYCSAGEAR